MLEEYPERLAALLKKQRLSLFDEEEEKEHEKGGGEEEDEGEATEGEEEQEEVEEGQQQIDGEDEDKEVAEDETQKKKRVCWENDYQHPFFARLVELTAPKSGFPNKMAMVCTHHQKVVNLYRPDFSVARAELVPEDSTVAVLVELTLSEAGKHEYFLRLTRYMEYALLSQPLRHSMICALTTLQWVTFFKCERMCDAAVPFVHTQSPKFIFNPNGFRRLMNLVAYIEPLLPIPTVINQAEVKLIRCIGGGASADVIAATWAGKNVAAKYFRANAADRLSREIKMLAKFLEQRSAEFAPRSAGKRARKSSVPRVPDALRAPLAPSLIAVCEEHRVFLMEHCEPITHGACSHVLPSLLACCPSLVLLCFALLRFAD